MLKPLLHVFSVLVLLVWLAAAARSETSSLTLPVDWSLDDPPELLTFPGFDTQNGKRELVSVEVSFDGILDLEVVIQNYSASAWEANDWYVNAGANIILAFAAKEGYQDGGPFFGLGGAFIDGITGALSAGSGGSPFDDPTPGEVDVSADTSVDVKSVVRSESDLDYFVSATDLVARTEPFLDFILAPPLSEPNALIQTRALNLGMEGEFALTYEFVERLGIPVDCNADGVVDVLDLDCACASGADVQQVLEATGLIAGDLDADGEVGFSDFIILSQGYGHPGGYTNGDLDCNGVVAFADFVAFTNNFGRSSAAGVAANVPEAASTWFQALLFAGYFRLRKRGTRHTPRARD